MFVYTKCEMFYPFLEKCRGGISVLPKGIPGTRSAILISTFISRRSFGAPVEAN